MADKRIRVLLVDDAPELLELLRGPLRGEGFDVSTAGDGESALELARSFDPHVVVLDLVLPGIDGLEVCRRLRQASDAYVLMLTSKSEEIDKLVGLTAGADDYMTKPFSAKELVARLRAMLRRPRELSGGTAGPRVFGELAIDAESREVSVSGNLVELTRIEFDLLASLASRPKVVFTRQQLLEKVWGPDWYGDEHLVDVHIAELRRKLGDDPKNPRYVRTVRGVGYRMVELGGG